MLQLPKVIGHRGAAAYSPENTLDSFREARRRGATWVETDIKLTADGVPIVMHDDSLKRTTGVDRLVAETPRAELPPSVPTFEEAIACFGELGLGCNVEIKPCPRPRGRDRRASWSRRCGAAGRPICRPPLLSSFKDASLAAARAAAPEFARALLLGQVRRRLAGAGRGGGGGGRQHQRREADRALGRAPSRTPGYVLGVYTIDDPDVATGAGRHGGGLVITDAPDVILAALWPKRGSNLRGCVLYTVLVDCHQTAIK